MSPNEPLPPIHETPAEEGSVLVVSRRGRVQNPAVAVTVLITAVFLVVAAMLAIFELNSQDSLNSIQGNQSVGLTERKQLTDVVCVIWDTMPVANRERAGADEVKLADEICASLKGPVPSTTATQNG